MKNRHAWKRPTAVLVTFWVAAACVPPRAPEVVPVEKPCAVSSAQAVVLGNNARAEFLSKRRQSTDGNLAVRVEEIGQRVARLSDRPGVLYQFVVVQGEGEAWSFPGGTVCITETLARMLSEGELAFALGHELAHIVLRHHINKYCQLVQASRGKRGEQVLLEAILSQLDRDQQIEADRYGALYAVRAGYEFSEAGKVLSKLDRLPGTVGAYAVRIDALEVYRGQLQHSLKAFYTGTELLRDGEIEEAIERLRFFVAEFPQSASGRVNLGAAYLSRVCRADPLDVVEALPILSLPDPLEIRHGMYDRIDLEHARRHFELALEVEPGEAYALAGLALVLIRLNEPGPAREYLERARELAPNSPEVVLSLGNSYFLGSEFEAAELHYRAALALRPGWNAARRNLAITYERLGRVADARELWQELTLTDNELLRIRALGRLRDLEKANPVPLD